MVILERVGGAGGPQPVETAPPPPGVAGRGSSSRVVPGVGVGVGWGAGAAGMRAAASGSRWLEVGPSLEPSPQEPAPSPALTRRTGRARVSRSRGTPGRSHTRAALSSVDYLSTWTVPQTPFLPQAVYAPLAYASTWYWFSAMFSQPLGRPVQRLPFRRHVGPERPVSVARPVT